MSELENYLKADKNTPRSTKSSVHYSEVRLKKSEEQSKLEVVGTEKIIDYVNEFLRELKIEEVNNAKVSFEGKININYKKIKKDYSLENEKDIIWMKFTKDGFLGVVASSNDVNFNIPKSKDDYNIKEKGSWKYATSGIIIHNLGKSWDESFVLVFPLKNIPEGLKRGDVETGIGNYLIEKGVPILDFYSHNY